MLVNTRRVRIEWGDCDPAGIIYYPRYLAFFDASTCALIERALGMKSCRFLAPTRFGDEVAIATTVTAIRRSSFDVRHRLMLDETLAVEGFETRVWVEGDPTAGNMKAVPLPADLVARLSHD